MVQVIGQNRTKPLSKGQQIAKGVGEAVETGKQYLQNYYQRQQMEKENEFVKKNLGVDLSGVTHPETRQQLMVEALRGSQNLEKSLQTEKLKGQSEAENFSKKFASQYGEKYKAQTQMLQELDLDQPYDYEGQFNPQEQPPQPKKDNDQQMADYLLGFDEEEPSAKQQPQQQPKKQYRPMIPQRKIDAWGKINPQEAARLQRYNDSIREEIRHDEDVAEKNRRFQIKEVTASFKENESFINKVHDQVEDASRREAILERMNQLNDSGKLSDSGLINSLEQLGMKQEWLKNPANEEYTKLALDLLGGGTLQVDYGSRVYASEFQVSQQRIPTLNQTPEGRRQIAENIKTLFLPAKLKNDRMQYYIDKAERTGEPLPHDLRGKVLKDIKPQLEEAYDKFKQRNGRYPVREGTLPDDNSIEKYYFLAKEDEDKAIKMMQEDGYSVK
jgi:hypothetical protein